MVMAAKELLASHHSPTDEDIKKAIRGKSLQVFSPNTLFGRLNARWLSRTKDGVKNLSSDQGAYDIRTERPVKVKLSRQESINFHTEMQLSLEKSCLMDKSQTFLQH